MYFRNSLHALYPPDNGWDVLGIDFDRKRCPG
jgi:hypothetical protein